MKKLNLLTLAFVLGTMSLFATTNFPSHPTIKRTIDTVKKLNSDSLILTNSKSPKHITFKYNEKGQLVILSMENVNEDQLQSVLENLNNKRRISAIREIENEMPDISRKE